MNTIHTICIVDDDEEIRSLLSDYLRRNGFSTCTAGNAAEFLEMQRRVPCSLIVMDIMLPGMNGLELFRTLRAESTVPVIFLTALGDITDRIVGLELGADDYISKPFRLRELMARIKTVLRRSKGAATEEIRISGLTVRMKEGKVLKNGQEVILTALEYKLLLTFLQNRGRVLSRNMLLESIWDVAGDFVSDNTLSVYIKRLREKIEDDPVEPQIIKTVRGMGYKVDE